MIMSMASYEDIWIHKLLIGLFDHDLDPMVIYNDNQSCINISKNPVFHDRSKHTKMKYHFIRDRIKNGSNEASVYFHW
jgi:hypothetical protein